MQYYDEEENQSDNTEPQEDGRNNSVQDEFNGYMPYKKQPNRLATASLICGIVGTVALCGCVAFPLSIILGVSAIALSIYSKKGRPFTGTAIAGLILGILSLLLGIAEGFYMIILNYMLRDPNMAPIFDQIMEQYGVTQAP